MPATVTVLAPPVNAADVTVEPYDTGAQTTTGASRTASSMASAASRRQPGARQIDTRRRAAEPACLCHCPATVVLLGRCTTVPASPLPDARASKAAMKSLI